MNCIYCGSGNIKKNGSQNNKQRYYCKSCRHSFCETTDLNKRSRTLDKVLQLLYNLLDSNFYNLNDLPKALELANSKYKDVTAEKIKYSVASCNNNSKDISINCIFPKLLICATDNTVTFYRIPKFDADENASNNNTHQERKIIITETFQGSNLKIYNINDIDI